MFDEQIAVAIISIALIGTVHFWSVPFYRAFPPQTQWMSDFSAGIGLGYAFLYLLPKIGEMSLELQGNAHAYNSFWDDRLYASALAGFLVYYLVGAVHDREVGSKLTLGLDTLAFGIYNCLVAIAFVHAAGQAPAIYALGTLVYVLHIFGVNKFLYNAHPRHMLTWLRPYFVAALALGCLIGLLSEDSGLYYLIGTAFVSGVIIILSLRIKLPTHSQLNVSAFLIGVVFVSSALLIAQS